MSDSYTPPEVDKREAPPPAQCSNYHGTPPSVRCAAPGAVLLLDPAGAVVPGGPLCWDCARRCLDEYAAKLGQAWGLRPYVHGRSPGPFPLRAELEIWREAFKVDAENPCAGSDGPDCACIPCTARRVLDLLDPHPCADCIDVHGDTAAEWLKRWPRGAERRDDIDGAPYLCDGCDDARREHGDLEDLRRYDALGLND